MRQGFPTGQDPTQRCHREKAAPTLGAALLAAERSDATGERQARIMAEGWLT